MSLICRIAGCRRKPHAHGLCQRHYDQERKSQQAPAKAAPGRPKGKPAAAAKPAPAAAVDDSADKNCVVPGCTNPHHARGYCKSHYGQLRRKGSIEEPPPSQPEGEAVRVSKERRLLKIMKRHEILKKEIANIHKELESEVDGE